MSTKKQIENLLIEVSVLEAQADQLDKYAELRKRQEQTNVEINQQFAKIEPFIDDAEKIKVLLVGKQQILAQLEKVDHEANSQE